MSSNELCVNTLKIEKWFYNQYLFNRQCDFDNDSRLIIFTEYINIYDQYMLKEKLWASYFKKNMTNFHLVLSICCVIRFEYVRANFEYIFRNFLRYSSLERKVKTPLNAQQYKLSTSNTLTHTNKYTFSSTVYINQSKCTDYIVQHGKFMCQRGSVLVHTCKWNEVKVDIRILNIFWTVLLVKLVSFCRD